LVQRLRHWLLPQESLVRLRWPLLLLVDELSARVDYHSRIDPQDTLPNHRIAQAVQGEGCPGFQSRQMLVIGAYSSDLFVVQIDQHQWQRLRHQDVAWEHSSQLYRVGSKHDDWLTMDLDTQHGMHGRKSIL
jgi:hypothetical protein